MSAPHADIYLNYTRPLTTDNVLTYKLNNSVNPGVRGSIRKAFRRIDSQIGLKIKNVNKRKDADVIINYTDNLPDHVVGLADVINRDWWVQMSKGSLASFHGPSASKLALHELGHVLGLNHHDEPGLMNVSIVASTSYFTNYELLTLQSIWGLP